MKGYKLLLLALVLVAVGLTTAIVILIFQSGLLGPPDGVVASETAELPYPPPVAEEPGEAQPPAGADPLEETTILPDAVVPGACTIDVDGANDVPDQTDVTQMCLFKGSTTFNITWSWDDITGTGSNTLDGCALFDNNGNGQVDYALCVRLMPDPNQNNRLVYHTTELWACADKKPDRCSSPMVQLIPSTVTSCNADQTPSDPFDATAPNGPGDDYPDDTTASCAILKNDVGGPGTVYVNSCSFPSGQSNSNPFDCLAALDGGFLTIEKVAIPNDPAVGFSFLISDTVTTVFTPTINGSGISPRYSVPVGSYAEYEIVPPGWQLTSASCLDQSGQPAGSGTNPVTGILISSGKDVICTFTDTAQATATATATSTATSTTTATATQTATATATSTATATKSTATATTTSTATATSTATQTPTSTATASLTPTETAGPSPTVTPTRERPGGGSNTGVVGFSFLFGALFLAGTAALMLGMYRRVKGTR